MDRTPLKGRRQSLRTCVETGGKCIHVAGMINPIDLRP